MVSNFKKLDQVNGLALHLERELMTICNWCHLALIRLISVPNIVKNAAKRLQSHKTRLQRTWNIMTVKYVKTEV